MDIATVALEAAALLTSSAAKGAAEAAGRSLWEALRSRVHRQFQGNDSALALIQNVDADTTEDYRRSLSDALEEAASADPDFANDLARLVAEAKGVPEFSAVFVSTSGNARIDKQANVGTNLGDINL